MAACFFQNLGSKIPKNTAAITCTLLNTLQRTCIYISRLWTFISTCSPSSKMAAAHLSPSRIYLNRRSISPPLLAHNRTTITARVAQNLTYWDSIQSDIDSHLKNAITIREPVSVFEPMHHLTFAAPKTTASALCVAACELLGGNQEDAIVAASAIHLVHAAVYTHDHLQLTDRVEPEPKTRHVFGSKIELLIGDGIMPFGFELLARSVDDAGKNSDKILRVITEITVAVGAEGVVDGQRSRRLHGCGAACGAILGGGNLEEVERLKRYGVYVGKVEELLSEIDRNGGGEMQLVKKWRAFAMKELEYFDSRKIEQISTILGYK